MTFNISNHNIEDFHIGQKVWTHYKPASGGLVFTNLPEPYEAVVTSLSKTNAGGGGQAVIRTDGEDRLIPSVHWLFAEKPEPLKKVSYTVTISGQAYSDSLKDITKALVKTAEGLGSTWTFSSIQRIDSL